MPSIIFTLNISSQEYLAYYQGKASQVRIKDGSRITLFPAEGLRPFVTHTGIHGRFKLIYDKNNKFVSLEKV
ncbi:MAG: DUF2835 domain-containing protein [Porticoccaceae bacterium]|nr:DUF2835 domain-containing protein [Porticoccaceae bacterium]